MRSTLTIFCAFMAIVTAAMAQAMFEMMPDISHESFAIHILVYGMQTIMYVLPIMCIWLGVLIYKRRI